jgi:hypothetical protein
VSLAEHLGDTTMTTMREPIAQPPPFSAEPGWAETAPPPARRDLLARLREVACSGLTQAYQPASATFPQTMRGRATSAGPQVWAEGQSTRYASMAALGLSTLPVDRQRRVLSGSTAAELAQQAARRAEGNADPGMVAIAAWAAAEVGRSYEASLFGDLTGRLDRGEPIPVVDLSWALTAAVAARDLGPTDALAGRVAQRLMAEQGTSGAFPHLSPADRQPRFRRHIGCFADQVYPIQAMSRWSRAGGGVDALLAANRCADVITARQGAAGQWWWHYDVRDGSVVERFPVYSVHQHAMGPMALLELAEAGGHDHRAAVDAGLDWLVTHPEVVDELIVDQLGVVWRKVGRRERFKAARALSAVTTSVHRGWLLPGLDRVLPPEVVDHECRPYELGWLLYAWRREGCLDEGMAS